MSPYSGSGLEGQIHISATGTCRILFHLFLVLKPMFWRRQSIQVYKHDLAAKF